MLLSWEYDRDICESIEPFLNAQDADGDTAVHLAMGLTWGAEWTEVIPLLKEADPTIRNKAGLTPLDLVLQQRGNVQWKKAIQFVSIFAERIFAERVEHADDAGSGDAVDAAAHALSTTLSAEVAARLEQVGQLLGAIAKIGSAKAGGAAGAAGAAGTKRARKSDE
jgi:hypothetical protein